MNTESHDYWICDIDNHTPNANLIGWFGVVSEQCGGVIAYFQSEQQALDFIHSSQSK